jgi:hypothetical protein
MALNCPKNGPDRRNRTHQCTKSTHADGVFGIYWAYPDACARGPAASGEGSSEMRPQGVFRRD